jgi:hypothetical protein
MKRDELIIGIPMGLSDEESHKYEFDLVDAKEQGNVLQ